MKIALTIGLTLSLSTMDCQSSRECSSAFSESIIGSWAEDTSSNASFIVREKEFYDFEHLYSYSYQLCGDTLTVLDSIFQVSRQTVVGLSSDSLILENADGSISRFVRR